MGLFKRKEKESSQLTNTVSDLEVHLKYWEFVFSRLVQGVTERAKKTLEKIRELICLELSQDLIKRLMNGFLEGNTHS
ncbi:MAG: hypothetical protein ACFFCD_15130 [Promethearchaeota archaeon]